MVTPPTAVEVTLTVTVHAVLAARVAPLSRSEAAPAVAETVPEGQVVLADGYGAMTMPLGAAPEVPSAVK